MKKTLSTLAFLLLLPLVFGIIAGPGGGFLSTVTAKAATAAPHPIGPAQELIIEPVFPGVTVTPNPKWELIPDLPYFPYEPLLPDPVTPQPDPVTPEPIEMILATYTPKPKDPTPKPPTGGGQYMTSEGPLFLSFRMDLTNELYMFTPMDLSVDAEYHFPLIGSSQQVVGDAKVVVNSGMAIVTYLVVNGVKVDEEDEFFTFFPDIRAVTTVKPSQLQHVKLRFGIPYSVAGWLNSDAKVLLYINSPISYKTNLKGLAPFSFDDPGYLQRVIQSLTLMD